MTYGNAVSPSDMMNESVSDLPVLFDQLMLADLKEKMSRFDNK